LIISNSHSFGEELESVLITLSDDRNQVIFDGRWTNQDEWKKTSLDEFEFTAGTNIVLRTAHQDNFIYVFIDAVTDKKPDKGEDKAIICFDGNNDKTLLPGNDDYCFGVSLGNNNGFVLQGGSNISFSNNFKKISKPDGFIAISAISDQNDRYSKIPHPSYEFKIPIELFGRSDNYGFYFSVYDGYSDKFYSWPDINPTKPLKIPSPSQWGNIISPDKSLPEFDLPLLLLFPALLLVITIARWKGNVITKIK
jgi:hypothetical protein